jgi:hypothetical protein
MMRSNVNANEVIIAFPKPSMPGMTALIPNRDNNSSTTAAMPGHTRSSFRGAASPGWEIFMRLYTSAARDLFHRSATKVQPQKGTKGTNEEG